MANKELENDQIDIDELEELEYGTSESAEYVDMSEEELS